jgi:hypothetical protein
MGESSGMEDIAEDEGIMGIGGGGRACDAEAAYGAEGVEACRTVRGEGDGTIEARGLPGGTGGRCSSFLGRPGRRRLGSGCGKTFSAAPARHSSKICCCRKSAEEVRVGQERLASSLLASDQICDSSSLSAGFQLAFPRA